MTQFEIKTDQVNQQAALGLVAFNYDNLVKVANELSLPLVLHSAINHLGEAINRLHYPISHTTHAHADPSST